MLSSELALLLEKYLEDTLSEEEFARLWETVNDERYQDEWHQVIQTLLDNRSIRGIGGAVHERLLLMRLRARIEAEPETFIVKTQKSRSVLINLAKYAALVVLLAGAGVFISRLATPDHTAPVATAPVKSPISVEPGKQRASLTLSDGSVILLDGQPDGQIARQGHVQVMKLAGGQLQYRTAGDAAASASALYNTMSTPRGGQYQLQLPDGSTVWLNAESSITYPVAFSPRERHVSIKGEVYFEVKKDAARPFRVAVGQQLVEVLGTHFNINAYADEGHVKTSLLEGAVRIDRYVLKPGQAFIDGRVVATDTEQDVAWKNGVFNFNDQDLAQVMRQLARWYNLDVDYAPGVPKKEYGGEMGRNLTLEQVLKGLENSGLHFQLDGHHLTVKP